MFPLALVVGVVFVVNVLFSTFWPVGPPPPYVPVIYDAPPDVPFGPNEVIAYSTILLSRDYVATTMVTCWSFRNSIESPWNSTVERLVVFVSNNVDVDAKLSSALLCCYDEIVRVPLFDAIQHPAVPRWKYQFTKLYFWNATQFSRLMYFDSDIIVLRAEKLRKIMLKNHELAMTQWIGNGGFSQDWFIGAFIVLRPNATLFEETAAHAKQYLKTHEETNDQIYISDRFRGKIVTLPHDVMSDMMLERDDPELWTRFVGNSALVHFTAGKPWHYSPGGYYDEWFDIENEVHMKCPYDDRAGRKNVREYVEALGLVLERFWRHDMHHFLWLWTHQLFGRR